MIYFDNAATGFPKSDAVARSMAEALNNCGNPGRSGHRLSLAGARTVFDCRKALANMFGTVPERVILTSGATESLNIALKGLCHGVTVISDMEHNAVLRPLNTLRRAGKTVMKQFSVSVHDDMQTLSNFSRVAKGASFVAVTHGSNVCGKILPIKAMRECLPKSTVFILDASQTAGHIPVDIKELGVDIICIPGHKGLYGPMGTGAMILHPKTDHIPRPLLDGGTGTESKNAEMPATLPERFEAGTQNVCGIAGLLAAIKEHTFCQREKTVFQYILDSMRRMVDITMYGAPVESVDDYVPVILFNKNGMVCEEVCDRLTESGIACRAGFHCAPLAHRALGTYESGGVRISFGRDSTLRQADKFLDALSQI